MFGPRLQNKVQAQHQRKIPEAPEQLPNGLTSPEATRGRVPFDHRHKAGIIPWLRKSRRSHTRIDEAHFTETSRIITSNPAGRRVLHSLLKLKKFPFSSPSEEKQEGRPSRGPVSTLVAFEMRII